MIAVVFAILSFEFNLDFSQLNLVKASGADSDTSGVMVHSSEDVEAPERTASISSGRSWADPYAKVLRT